MSSALKSDEKHVEHTIDTLNGRLCDGTIFPDDIIKLFRLCMSRKKKAIAHLCVVTGMFLYSNASLTAKQAVQITLCGFEYWRGDGFMTKGHYRVNTLPERRNMIEDIAVILGGLDELQHPELGDIISFNLAMALESSGDFVKALSVYSDLITREAGNGVDLSLIIFRAAVVLLHLGREAQACDYLDFIQEDAPVTSGYGRAHVLALLSIIYEGRGKKFTHMLDSITTAFQHIREDEMPFLLDYAEKKKDKDEPTSHHKFITFSTAKIWEALALQALSKGDYVYAIEMLKQLMRRNPKSKSGVYLTLSESFYVLGEKDLALEAAEASYEIQSQSVEVRNMLLLIAPEKWQDPLRLAPPVRVMKITHVEDDDAVIETDIKSRLNPRKGTEVISPSKPREVIPAVGGSWLIHLTPHNKNFQDSPPSSPTRSTVPSEVEVENSTGSRTRGHSEFDIQDMYSNPSTRVNSKLNTPRELEGSQSDRPNSSGQTKRAQRKKSLRPEKPASAMDEDTKRLVRAMLSSGNTASAALTTPTYDLIASRLAIPATNDVRDIIAEEDSRDSGEEDSDPPRKAAGNDSDDKNTSWLFRTPVDEEEHEQSTKASSRLVSR